MRAVVAHALSPQLDQVEVVDRSVPKPGPGQVLVRMRYAPVNPSDLNYVHGTYHEALAQAIWNRPGERPVFFDPHHTRPCAEPPYVLGGEGMGIVEAAGPGLLARRLVGKRVAVAGGPTGTWAELALIDARRAVPVPGWLNDEQAAMFFVNPLAATIMVRHVLRVERGAWLLQTAAGSALGKSVVRMGHHLNFRTLNVVRGEANVAALGELGADAIVTTDTQDLIAEVRRLTDGHGVPAALDCVGGALAADVVRCLGLGGRMLLYGTLSRDPIVLPPRHLMMPLAQLEGFFLGNWLLDRSPVQLLRVLRQVKALFKAGVFTTEVAEHVPVERAPEALAATLERGRTGKIVLEF